MSILKLQRLFSFSKSFWLSALIVLMVFFSSQIHAAGECSPYIGQASLNEFFKDRANQANDGDDFAEVKILNPTITSSIYNNWSVKLCEDNGAGNNNDNDGDDCTEYTVSLSDFEISTTPWKILKDGNVGKYINFKTGFEAVLLDHNNDVIDYARIGVVDTPQLEGTNCKGTDLPFPFLGGAPGASAKFVFRTPDGTGPWGSASSGSVDGTEEDTNDVPSGGGSYPVLTVSDVTVTKGNDAVFTLTLDKAPVTAPITINYETLGGTAIPSTTSPYDYTYADPSVSFVSFAAGETTKTITITTQGSGPASSGTVFFYLFLQSPTANVTLNNAYPKGTILGTFSQTIVLSTGSGETLDGLTFTNGDLAQYDPVSSPATLYFDESNFAGGDENISAVHVLDNGNIILSTGNGATLGGLSFRDGDLVEYDPTLDTATLYFSENNFFLGFLGLYDISAVYVDETNDDIILSTTGTAFLGGQTIRNGDLVKYDRSNGSTTLFFNQDNFNDANVAIDGVHILDSGNILLTTTIGATLGGYTFRDGDVIEYNPTTNIASLYFDQNLFSRNGADINALSLPKSISTSIDHFEIWHDGSGLTCQPETIKIRACADNASPCTLYPSDVAITLSPTVGATTSWLPDPQVITAGTVTDFSLAYKTLSPSGATSNTVTLNITSPSYSTTCKDLAGNPSTCNIIFNDSGFIFDATTQTSCVTSSNIKISAVRKNPTTEQCIPFFNGKTVPAVKFWAEYSSPSSGTQQVTLNYAGNDYPLATSSPGTDVTNVTFDASGEANFTLTYDDAGELNLNATYTGSTATSDDGLSMAGNQLYVTKPAKLYVYSDDANASCPSADPTNANCNPAFRKTGEDFNLKVRGACADNSVTPNFKLDGIGISSNLIAPTGTGTLNANLAVPSVNITTNGEAVIANQNVDQVGVFTFTASMPAAPATYLGETVIGSTALNTSANIGRFTPDHFETVVTHGCTGGSTFTYSGQPFTTTVYARNQNNATTVNYRDGFAFGVTLSDANPAAPATGIYANNTIDSTSFSSDTPDNGSEFGVGSTEVANDLTYTFSSKDTVPDILDIRATDQNNTPGDATDDLSSNGFAEGTTEIRSGRTQLENAYGSELVDLQVPAQVQYYTANGFVTNVDDTCSTINVTLTDPGSNTVNLGTGSGETCIWDDADNSLGVTDFTCLADATKPQFTEPPIAGSFNLFLKSPGADFTGDIGVILNSPSWLQFDWDNDGSDDDDPNSTASFGLYRGDDRIIYWREVF